MSLIARKWEQKLLNQALNKQESQFIAVYGRRRIGKTYLIKEMFSDRFTFEHTGYYNVSRKEQLSGFFKSLRKAGLNSDYSCPSNWIEAFDLLEIVVEQSKAEKKRSCFWMNCPGWTPFTVT